MSQRELVQIPIDATAHPETVERWNQLRHAVASELDVDAESLAKWEIVREASEAYCGGEPCGRWKNGESDA